MIMQYTQFIKEYRPAQIIFEEGGIGDKMYIVQDGTVAIEKQRGDTAVHLATLSKGEVFGEMALVEEQTRSATVVAGKKSATLVEVDSSLFVYLVSQQPVFALVVLKSMSKRLRKQILSDVVELV